MSLFKNLNPQSQGLEPSEDRLGGFQVFDSGIYLATIKNLFAGESQKGAMSLTLIADIGDGQEYQETLYITNRNKENYFVPKGSTKKAPLPGFTIANDLCLIACEKELHELETEEKIVKVYDPEAKTQVPKAVPVITEAIGKKVALGILKQLENKNEKNAAGDYVPTAETRETNLIDKVFHPELKVTVAEARKGADPTFWDAWLKRNEDQVRDRREIKDGGTGAPPKAGAKTAAGAPVTGARKSLFGK